MIMKVKQSKLFLFSSIGSRILNMIIISHFYLYSDSLNYFCDFNLIGTTSILMLMACLKDCF